jgi:hypothetical protein
MLVTGADIGLVKGGSDLFEPFLGGAEHIQWYGNCLFCS